MSIFSKILSKIFPPAHAGQATPVPAPTSPASNPAPEKNENTVINPAISAVDVAVILDGLVQKKGEQLNWRTSIVDLLKLLDLDSSLQSRKELAAELQYQGDTSDSATMNIWLHRQVMNKLAANGGKVPADLKD